MTALEEIIERLGLDSDIIEELIKRQEEAEG